MLSPMTVLRVVPLLTGPADEAARGFYADVLGLQTVMDHGWIATLGDPDRPACQLSLLTADLTAPEPAAVSIEVDDVDAAYAAARARDCEIVHPLTDEPWGVRRFLVRAPGGHVLNVLQHR